MARILIVVTSANRMGESDRPTGIWLEEFTTPLYEFLDAGHEVTITSPAGGAVPVDPASLAEDALSDSTRRFEADGAHRHLLEHATPLRHVNLQEYDAVFIPGGHGPMWDLAADESVAALVTACLENKRPLGAVCHGPAAFVAAKRADGNSVLANRHVTGFANTEEEAVGLATVVPFLLQDRLVSLGAQYSRGRDWGEYVVTDGQLVTGQNPASAGLAARRLMGLFSEAEVPQPQA
jgi:putative intracellular protease/amidase